jgi:predicted patatin/cPLA2 family phospholipase
MFGNFGGSSLLKLRLYHPRVHILIFGGLGIGGSYAATFMEKFVAFKYMYCVSFGLVAGATYTTALGIAW